MEGGNHIAMINYLKIQYSSPKHIWIRFILAFINSFTSGMSYFLPLYFVKTLGFNVATSGFLMSFFGLGFAIGGVLGGKLSDVKSTQHVIIASNILKIFAILMLAFVTSAFYIATSLLFIGITTYAFKTSNNVSILNDLTITSSERLKRVNILRMMSNLGLGLSAAIVMVFWGAGLKYLFIFMALLLIVSLIMLIRNFETRCNENSGVKLNDSVDQNESPKVYIAVFSIFCVFLVGLVTAQLNSTYGIFIHQNLSNEDIRKLAFLFILNPVLIIIFQVPVVNALGRYNKIILTGVSAFLYAFGFFVLSISNYYAVAIVSCLIYTFAEMSFFSVAELLCFENAPQDKKGFIFGLYQSAFAVSITVGPALGGFIYHALGGAMVWYLCGLTGMLCLLGSFYVGMKK